MLFNVQFAFAIRFYIDNEYYQVKYIASSIVGMIACDVPSSAPKKLKY